MEFNIIFLSWWILRHLPLSFFFSFFFFFFFLFFFSSWSCKSRKDGTTKNNCLDRKKNFLIIFHKKDEKRLNKIVKCWQPGGLETLERLWNLKINCRRTSRVKVEEAGDAVFSLASWVKHDGTCNPGIFS